MLQNRLLSPLFLNKILHKIKWGNQALKILFDTHSCDTDLWFRFWTINRRSLDPVSPHGQLSRKHRSAFRLTLVPGEHSSRCANLPQTRVIFWRQTLAQSQNVRYPVVNPAQGCWFDLIYSKTEECLWCLFMCHVPLRTGVFFMCLGLENIIKVIIYK